MSEPSDRKSVDFEEASSKLGEGLKTCRAVLSGYRTLLGASTANDNMNAGNPGEPEGRMDLPDDC